MSESTEYNVRMNMKIMGKKSTYIACTLVIRQNSTIKLIYDRRNPTDFSGFPNVKNILYLEDVAKNAVFDLF